MIDNDGYLKCDGCGKTFGRLHNDKIEIVCARCKRFNVFKLIKEYISHKLECLTIPKK